MLKLSGRLWRHSDFKKLWFGQFLSNFGDRISRIALPTLVILVLDGGPVEVGVLLTLTTVPYLVLGPFAGVIADRVSRRGLLIGTDLARLASLLSIPAAYALDGLTLAHVYVVVGLNGVLTVFFEVSYQSYLPRLVGQENLVEANSKLQFTRSAADIGGSSASGGLIQAVNAVFAVFIDALTFLVSSIAVLFIKDREPKVEEKPDISAAAVLAEAREGLKVIASDVRLRVLMSSTGLVNLGTAAANALLLLFAYQIVGLTPGQVGLAFAAAGVGLLLGAAFAGRIAKAITLSGALVSAVLTSAVAFLLLGTSTAGYAFGALIVAQLMLGAANSIYNVHVLSLVGGITPNELLGRVSGTALMVVHGSGALGAALGGLIGAAVGIRDTMIGSAVLIGVAAVVILLSPVRAIKRHPGQESGPPAPGEPADAAGAPDPEPASKP
ncbi:MAG TPA: MFS transporter [Glycomyces sp.]|nr:MFS transporter [Glycomyces sp.]